MVGGEQLYAPELFWEKDFSLKSESYILEKLDNKSPWYGLKGSFNHEDNMWHGMGGCNDYMFVGKLIDNEVKSP